VSIAANSSSVSSAKSILRRIPLSRRNSSSS
jgi:hypothetical protein